MSRHHMLPPIVYAPPPKPKKIETRKRRIQVGSTGSIDDMDEAGETHETTGFGQATPAVQRIKLAFDAMLRKLATAAG